MKHPTKRIERKVAVVGCKHTTLELLLGLERHGYRVDHCIIISPEKARQQGVAGYQDLRPFLEQRSIPYTVAEKYSLKSERDRETILSLKLDLMLVNGWQRLIPDAILQGLSIGAFGMHGSSKPLPHGRGRSPMNWSLIQGKTIFYTHLFRYEPGADDGPIVGVQRFDISKLDTCLTLHLKNTVSMIRLCTSHLPALLDGTAKLTPQPKEGATYYPKRTPADGLIYWQDTTEDIYNLVRAVTKPFPGAFSFLDNNPDQPVVVWRAQPFDSYLDYADAQPGEVVEVFSNGMFVVRTGDSSLLVVESDNNSLTHKDRGRRFGNLGTPRKDWGELPQ